MSPRQLALAAMLTGLVAGYLLGAGEGGTRVEGGPARCDLPQTGHLPQSPSRAPAAGRPTATPRPALAPAPVEESVRLQPGNDIIDRALASGRWTDEDATALDAAIEELDGPDRARLLMRVAAATNADRLQIETTTYPY